MKRRVSLSGILTVMSWLAVAAADEPARHLLLDERIVERTENAVLRVGTVEKSPANPLFGEDHAWEARFDNLYPTVLYDEQEQIYKAWYFMFTRDAVDANGQPVPRDQRTPGAYKNYDKAVRTAGLAYATSDDGIHWTKPMMNNVLWDGQPSNLLIENMEGAGVIKDINEPDATRRYKMFGKSNIQPFMNSLAVSFSPDGINWSTPTYAPEAHAAADTHNNALWAPELNKYVGITRLWSEKPIQRIVGRTESADFVHWTEATEVMRGDLQHQTYSMRVFHYAGTYLGFVTILSLDTGHPETYDHMATELAWSADGVQWQRIDPGRPLIGNSSQAGTYDWGCVNSALPIFQDDQTLIYYGASNGTHGHWRDGFLARATLRPDGFAGYEPQDSDQPAIVVTNPVSLDAALEITADAAGGSITVSVLDATGKVLLTSRPVTANGTDERVSWSDGGTLEKLAGQQVRLRFAIRRAKLYSFVL